VKTDILRAGVSIDAPVLMAKGERSRHKTALSDVSQIEVIGTATSG